MLEDYGLVKEVYLLLDDGDREFLLKYDLTPVQWYSLLWLDNSLPQTLNQLSRELLCDPGNVTRLTDRLEKKGLIQRQRNGQDRRQIFVSLTPKGQALCNEIRQAHAQYTQARLDILSQDEQTELKRLLLKFKTGLENQLRPPAA